MKFHFILSIAALGALTVFLSCKNDSSASKDTSLQSEQALDQTAAAPAADPAAAPAPTAEPPQNAAGVWHYTCPKGCAGGAGSAIACATCGTTLTHNQTYHGTPPAGATPSATPGAPGAPPVTMPNAAKPEPPQNAAGVWHYTCPGGCAGGGGAAGPCAKCGKTLEHNKAYH